MIEEKILKHRLSTTSCGTTLFIKWPGSLDYKPAERDGKRRLFNSEESAKTHLIGLYERFFTLHLESWQKQNKDLAIKRKAPMVALNELFGKDGNLHLKGGRVVEVEKKTRRRFNHGRS